MSKNTPEHDNYKADVSNSPEYKKSQAEKPIDTLRQKPYNRDQPHEEYMRDLDRALKETNIRRQIHQSADSLMLEIHNKKGGTNLDFSFRDKNDKQNPGR